METFSITTRLTTAEYAKVFFKGLYKRPVFILSTVLGLYLIMSPFIYGESDTPLYETAVGCFLLLAPCLIALAAIKQFTSNPSFKNDVTYTFSESGVTVQGQTFKGEFVWAHINKQKEIGRFLILYHTKKAGTFIDKSKLTQEQVEFIKG